MKAAMISLAALALLGGCERRGNLKTAADYDPPPAPKVARLYYDPYAAYGEANARWRPVVGDQRGTIVAPGVWGGREAGRANEKPPGVF